MDFFESIAKKMRDKKRNKIKAIVEEKVREKIKSWDPDKLAYFQQRYDENLKTPFEKKKRIGTLTQQYEIFLSEYNNLTEKKLPYEYEMLFSMQHVRSGASGVGFLCFAEEVLKEYGLLYENYDELSTIAYEFVETYKKRKAELEYDPGPVDLIRLERGIEGEERLQKQLDIWGDSEEFYLLNNAVLEYNGKSFETDALLFTRYGLFSLEVKNIGEDRNYKIKITEDGQWLKIVKNKEEALSNITSQVNYHVSMTERMIKGYEREKNKRVNIPVNSLVIIANEDVRIENHSDIAIARVDLLMHNMRKKEARYDLKEMKALKDWFEKHAIDEKGYEYDDFYQEFLWRENEINETKKRFYAFNEELTEVYDEIIRENRWYQEFCDMAKHCGKW